MFVRVANDCNSIAYPVLDSPLLNVCDNLHSPDVHVVCVFSFLGKSVLRVVPNGGDRRSQGPPKSIRHDVRGLSGMPWSSRKLQVHPI